jgi:P pilus assembly chaperone PapD
MTGFRSFFRNAALAALAAMSTFAPAHAELVLSDLVVELLPGKESRKDIELWNDSDERSYVEISPAEIVNAGQPSESRRVLPDPEQLGLLVSPNRMILEPGQHKIIRIAAIAPSADRERIYRITVKPVVGDISAEQSGLKVLVGYDVLTMVRPANPAPRIVGSRDGNNLVVRNEGNASTELLNGKQCEAPGKACSELPGKRLYAGAEWRLPLERSGPIEYSVKLGQKLSTVRF